MLCKESVKIMNKKNKLILLVIMVLATIIIVSLLLNVSSRKENYAPNQNFDSSYNSSTSLLPLYILKEHNGNVAVFKYGQTRPIEIIDEIVFISLPEYDRQQLINGIFVYSEEELHRLIEDLES